MLWSQAQWNRRHDVRSSSPTLSVSSGRYRHLSPVIAAEYAQLPTSYTKFGVSSPQAIRSPHGSAKEAMRSPHGSAKEAMRSPHGSAKEAMLASLESARDALAPAKSCTGQRRPSSALSTAVALCVHCNQSISASDDRVKCAVARYGQPADYFHRECFNKAVAGAADAALLESAALEADQAQRCDAWQRTLPASREQAAAVSARAAAAVTAHRMTFGASMARANEVIAVAQSSAQPNPFRAANPDERSQSSLFRYLSEETDTLAELHDALNGVGKTVAERASSLVQKGTLSDKQTQAIVSLLALSGKSQSDLPVWRAGYAESKVYRWDFKTQSTVEDPTGTPIEIFLEYFANDLWPEFVEHHDLAVWQDFDWQQQKKNMPRGACVTVEDFTENFTHLFKHEPQSAYWQQIQSGMHVLVAQFHLDDCDNIDDEEKEELRRVFDANGEPHFITESHIVISPDAQHGFAMVQHFREEFFTPYVRKNMPNVIRCWCRSDGCRAQYKGRHHFGFISSHGEPSH